MLPDLANSVAKLRREMRREDDHFEIDVGMIRKLFQRPIQMTVIGSRSRNDSDRLAHTIGLASARSHICWRRVLGT